MSKYCKAYALHVTYLDCMECETKECKNKKKEGSKVSEMVYLALKPDEEVFLVFASKREGYTDNVVCRCKIEFATVYRDETVYHTRLEKIVLGNKKVEDVKRWVSTFMFENQNINTGYRSKPNRYPVFTTKEKCIQWLKG